MAERISLFSSSFWVPGTSCSTHSIAERNNPPRFGMRYNRYQYLCSIFSNWHPPCHKDYIEIPLTQLRKHTYLFRQEITHEDTWTVTVRGAPFFLLYWAFFLTASATALSTSSESGGKPSCSRLVALNQKSTRWVPESFPKISGSWKLAWSSQRVDGHGSSRWLSRDDPELCLRPPLLVRGSKHSSPVSPCPVTPLSAEIVLMRISGAFVTFCGRLLYMKHIWKQKRQLCALRASIQTLENVKCLNAFKAFYDRFLLRSRGWQLER